VYTNYTLTDSDGAAARLHSPHDAVVIIYRQSDGRLWERRVVPTPERPVTDRVVKDAVDSQQPAAEAVLDGETVRVLFVDESSRSIFSTHDGTGWQPSTLRVDTILGSWIRGNVYTCRDGKRSTATSTTPARMAGQACELNHPRTVTGARDLAEVAPTQIGAESPNAFSSNVAECIPDRFVRLRCELRVELSVTSSMQPAVERVSAVNGIGRYYRATPGSPCDLPERESGYLATG
jgi:hypothetical protein